MQKEKALLILGPNTPREATSVLHVATYYKKLMVRSLVSSSKYLRFHYSVNRYFVSDL